MPRTLWAGTGSPASLEQKAWRSRGFLCDQVLGDKCYQLNPDKYEGLICAWHEEGILWDKHLSATAHASLTLGLQGALPSFRHQSCWLWELKSFAPTCRSQPKWKDPGFWILDVRGGRGSHLCLYTTCLQWHLELFHPLPSLNILCCTALGRSLALLEDFEA